MKYHNKNIIKIDKIAPIIIVDAEEDKKFLNKNGVYIIEYEDNSISTIDLKNNVDLTNIDNIEVGLFEKSKKETIFDISINDKMLELEDIML